MTPGSVVRSQAVVPASEVVARHLALVPGTPVVHLERVRTADGEPMALERTHLPAQRLPGLDTADLTDASLYELVERDWDVRVARRRPVGQRRPTYRPTRPPSSRSTPASPPCCSSASPATPAAPPSSTSAPSIAATATRSTPASNASTADPRTDCRVAYCGYA